MSQLADLLSAVAGMPRPKDGPQRKYVDDKFISRVLRLTRMGSNSRNTSCRRIASLAHSLEVLDHKPDFGFMHNFTQSCRYMWTGFTPQVICLTITCLASV